MQPVYKVAVVQLCVEPLQPDVNFQRASDFIRDAAAQGAQLAVLPEYHLTGWEPQDERFAQQCGRWAEFLERYQQLARELHICIVPGTIVERHDSKVKPGAYDLLNTAYFIDETGNVCGRYVKANLWHPERPYLTGCPNQPHAAFETPLGRVGLLICWDICFPEAFRELIADGAKMIIIPTFWGLHDCSPYGLSLNPEAEKLFLDSALTARAYENTCAVVFANVGGTPGAIEPGTWLGLSRVTLPFIGPMGATTKDTADEGMSLVDIDMQVPCEAEKVYKVRQDLAREDWHYAYRRRHSGSDAASEDNSAEPIVRS